MNKQMFRDYIDCFNRDGHFAHIKSARFRTLSP
jgi:hypothetical protein